MGLQNDQSFENSGQSSFQSIMKFTHEEERAVLRKVDWYLLPGLTFLYLLSFLDRANISNAKLLGMLHDIGITEASDYNTALALYFIAYCACEVPANMVLKKFNPQLWLPILTVGFGITSLCQAFISNKAGFYAARFFLGASEAGLFAGCVFVFSMYYKRNERHWRVAIFFGGAALAGSAGGILAWGIGHIENSSLAAWSWIFIIEGLFTTLVGFSAFFWVPNYPQQATFLTEREKEILLHRLELDNDDTAVEEAFSWSQVKAAFTDKYVWAYCFLFHAFAFPLYSLSLFFPTIIAQLGYTSWEAQLLTTPAYALAFISILLIAYASHKTQKRGLWIIIASIVSIVGYIVVLTSSQAGSRYAGIFIAVMGVYAANALILSWPSENVGGSTKRAIAGAMQITFGDIGAISGVLVYRPSLNVNFFRVPHIIAIGYVCFGIVVATYLWISMARDNRNRLVLRETGNEKGRTRDQNGLVLGDRALTFVYQI